MAKTSLPSQGLSKRYLERLSDLYPTITAASTEVINLSAILQLPKGTEHFLTDVHGENEAFSHVLRNASGTVRHKIDDIFGNSLSQVDKRELATLIYYPEEKMHLVFRDLESPEDWYRVMLCRLIKVARNVANKYTRSKVRKALPAGFDYVLEELLMEREDRDDKESYYESILSTIISLNRAREFIIALCSLIQRLVIDHLHIIGDIYDRGPGPHLILDTLMNYHSVDIQWGNHDVLWMGAAAGEIACICNVIRICARYGNLDILEDGYGINMLPLASYAMGTYEGDPCSCFHLKGNNTTDEREMLINLKIHKAVSILQFKAEGQLILAHPEFQLEKRNLLHRIDFQTGLIALDGKTYKMLDTHFPTVDPANPYAYTAQEADLVERLIHAFKSCEKLQQHIKFLLRSGNLYKVYNGNLLFHGCMPLAPDGSFACANIYGKKYKGKALYEVLESYIRKGFVSLDVKEREKGRDLMWWVWLHKDSPLFGKDKMATFERYFLEEKETHEERKNPYYLLCEKEEIVEMVLAEFGLAGRKDAHIINGHVPVKEKNGESPIKCGGKLLVIDGGFARAYQKETGIAGYTLISNSNGLVLAAHDPFKSTEDAIASGTDIHSDRRIVARVNVRKRVKDTDIGKELEVKIRELEALIDAYRNGDIAEQFDASKQTYRSLSL